MNEYMVRNDYRSDLAAILRLNPMTIDFTIITIMKNGIPTIAKNEDYQLVKKNI